MSIKSISEQTYKKLAYNIGRYPDSWRSKYDLLLERIKKCKSCLG